LDGGRSLVADLGLIDDLFEANLSGACSDAGNNSAITPARGRCASNTRRSAKSIAERRPGSGEEQPIDGSAELFRAVNERIRELEGDRADYYFICECGDDSCTRAMLMTAHEYAGVRADPRCFAVLPGHEQSAREQIVGRGSSYVVVRKRGDETRAIDV
jgi:hypothetical protein